jgi:hypothetical protein
MPNELFGSGLFGETPFGGEPGFPVSDSDSGTLSAVEAQSLEIQRVIDETDAGTLGDAEQLTLARDPADAGTLLSDEAIVFERAQADAGTISAAEALTAARELADAGTFAAEETATRFAMVIVNEADAGTLAGAEAHGTGKFALKAPPALRVTNYLRRTV